MGVISIYSFNSRTHTGCDFLRLNLNNFEVGVSIHAPTQGATNFLYPRHSLCLRFNSRTHTGCDRYLYEIFSVFCCFNSRTHTGCDVARWISLPLIMVFQFTHPHRVRLICKVLFCATLKFQFTHPHRVRLLIFSLVRSYLCFNSRTHTGCDAIRPEVTLSIIMFQFTHPHRVRRQSEPASNDLDKFQFTHPHRVRPPGIHKLTYLTRFNSRTHTGCDGRANYLRVSSGCFNSRTHTGCDIIQPVPRKPLILFQFTHPHRVRRAGEQINNLRYGFNSRTHTGCDSNSSSM